MASSAVVQLRPRPSGSPALIHGISSGGLVRKQVERNEIERNRSGAASEKKTIISAFRISIARRRQRIGKTSGLSGRRINNSASNHRARTPPLNQNDSGGTDPTRSCQTADLAFQHAMRCAIARGLEHPPSIGIVRDPRPLNAPRLFDPVPHSSGCTSPAFECAELAAHNDQPHGPHPAQ
jgi:hypothetical protein